MAKILLVDDEKDIVEFLQYNLEAEGFEVISANDGVEALFKMEEKLVSKFLVKKVSSHMAEY